MDHGWYYLGRVVKGGLLDSEKLIQAILAPQPYLSGKYSWTITDVAVGMESDVKYVFGRLTKYSHEGQVAVVDTAHNAQVPAPAENLVIASAPFVYLPDYSGVAYLHVWNQIEEHTFRRRFKQIIESTLSYFFIECSIEPISDYQQFIARLRQLRTVIEISATVHPPNPLYGRLWESLKRYLEDRNATKLTLNEESSRDSELKTQLLPLMQNVLQNPDYEPPYAPSITDAAIIMAADGYGRGKVVGHRDGSIVILRTSETQKNFEYAKDPAAESLAIEAATQLARISNERGMQH